ncbi:MAG: hypothetical protein ACFE0O_00700 [Opitutales bacterium]
MGFRLIARLAMGWLRPWLVLGGLLLLLGGLVWLVRQTESALAARPGNPLLKKSGSVAGLTRHIGADLETLRTGYRLVRVGPLQRWDADTGDWVLAEPAYTWFFLDDSGEVHRVDGRDGKLLQVVEGDTP